MPCSFCDQALKNEKAWIDIGLETSRLLERACLALPEESPERAEGLAQVAAVRTTPIYSAKRGPKTRSYPLPEPEVLAELPFEHES